jgi:hypothetical protein
VLQRLGILDQHASPGTVSDADHDRHRGEGRVHRGRQ